MADHTTSDDASRYRPKEEVEEWSKKDPLDRLRKYMQAKGLWSQEYEAKTVADATAKVEDAVKKLEAVPAQELEDIFKYVHAEMTPQLKEQLEYLRQFYPK